MTSGSSPGKASDWRTCYPLVVEVAPPQVAVLPGEVVCCDEKGVTAFRSAPPPRFHRLCKRGSERRDEIVWQLLDEPDRVGDEHARLRLRLPRAHRRVKRSEELVRDQHLAVRERAHERRLPCVRISNQRDPELIATRGSTLVVVSLDTL